MQAQQQFNIIADELTALLPEDAPRSAGGVLSKIVALVTALKAGDFPAILKAVYELLGEFVESETTNFGAPVSGVGMKFKELLSILATILGLLGK